MCSFSFVSRVYTDKTLVTLREYHVPVDFLLQQSSFSNTYNWEVSWCGEYNKSLKKKHHICHRAENKPILSLNLDHIYSVYIIIYTFSLKGAMMTDQFWYIVYDESSSRVITVWVYLSVLSFVYRIRLCGSDNQLLYIVACWTTTVNLIFYFGRKKKEFKYRQSKTHKITTFLWLNTIIILFQCYLIF